MCWKVQQQNIHNTDKNTVMEEEIQKIAQTYVN